MELKKLSSEVVQIVKEVGSFIREEHKVFSKANVQFKSDHAHDLVSYVDITAEKLLIEKLGGIFPEAGFIAEESHTEYRDGLNWIIDPLDGTTNFIQRVPHFCVSVALADGEDLLIGVVYEINRDECFYTWKGGGSFCNDDRISVSNVSDLRNSFVATGFSVKNTEKLPANLELLKIWISKTRGIRRLGTAALDLCYVAKGVFDVFYETNLSAWDVAAGALIVQNAGGRVSTFSGGADFLFGDEIIATNALLNQVFLSEIEPLNQ